MLAPAARRNGLGPGTVLAAFWPGFGRLILPPKMAVRRRPGFAVRCTAHERGDLRATDVAKPPQFLNI
jgi:hypothetical protein